MIIIQCRHKGKTYEVWDLGETVSKEIAEAIIKKDKAIHPDSRFQYRIVEVIKDFE